MDETGKNSQSIADLASSAIEKAKEVKVFASRWKSIVAKLEQIPQILSDLSSHPCFARSTLCKEQLQALSQTLKEAMSMGETCIGNTYDGKLRMQNDLDNLIGKLTLNLKDCGVLIKTGVLGEVSLPSSNGDTSITAEIRELLARLLLGNIEAKHKALDTLVEMMKEEEATILSSLRRSHVAALVHLLTATSFKIREKTVTLVCSIAEAGACEKWLVSEGVLPPLIRLSESGTPYGKEKATISLQRLSMSADTSRAIVGHGGVPPLAEICRSGDSITQSAAASTLKSISSVPETRHVLVEEGVIEIMINLLSSGVLLGTKEYAAECMQNLSTSENTRKLIISSGGIESLLAYVDGPVPQESAVSAVRNLAGCVPVEKLISMGFLARMVHVFESGSMGAQRAAASAICKVSGTMEMKKMVGECGCVYFLLEMLESKEIGAREVAAQALMVLMGHPQNKREVKREERSVPRLVRLLDHGAQNTAKKYAVGCLLVLASCRKCRKMMVSYGAVGYLKKLRDMDVCGAKKLLARLERRRLTNLFLRS